MEAYGSSILSPLEMEAAINSMATLPSKSFLPAAFLDDSPISPFPYVLLVLNTPIHKGDLFEKCCSKALAVIAADGGANRIYDYCREGSTINLVNKLRPDSIIGDLDSLTSEAERFFRERGTTIIQDEDQYSTDFTKSLRHIANHRHWWLDMDNRANNRMESQLKVLIYGGLGGRADQAFSQLHHLYSAAREPLLQNLDLYLLTGESIIFLLPGQTMSVIQTPLALLGENIGIIPMGRPAMISTSGLEWDVQGWQTEFGGQISTSNHIRAPQILVTASENVLFTVEIQGRLHGLHDTSSQGSFVNPFGNMGS